MTRKLTNEKILDTLFKWYPNSKDIEIQRVSVGIHKRWRVKFKCGICGNQCDSLYDNLRKGRACNICGLKKLSDSFRFYDKEFIHKELNNLGFEWINSDKYKNASSSLETRCLKCGNISKANVTNRIVEKRKCKVCEGFDRKSIEEVRKEIYSLVGNEYTLLSDKYINAGSKMLIKHNTCGHEYYVSRRNFKKGRRCPNCIIFKGERKIQDLLENKNIVYIKEKSFEDLRGLKGGLLRYDFYLPDHNLLIEYDGELHYENTSLGNDLHRQKIHDEIKNNYAKSKGIRLIRIPYWDFDNIEKILNKALFK